jgi:hypothetical protein
MALNEVKSRRRALLLLVLISRGTLLNVQLKPIEHIIETICKLTRTLHWIISQQIDPEITSRERTLL